MSEELCQCPACGRTHSKMTFGPPPDSELTRLRVENERLMVIIKSSEPFEDNERLQRQIKGLQEALEALKHSWGKPYAELFQLIEKKMNRIT